MRATFVYANSRRDLMAGVASGEEPDSALYGALQLREHGIDVRVHDPLLTRRTLPAWLDRAAWNLREVSAPGSELLFLDRGHSTVVQDENHIRAFGN